MEALGCDFAQVYGLTETTGAITSLLPEDHDPGGPRSRLLQSAGRPFHHVELRIVDPEPAGSCPLARSARSGPAPDQNMLGLLEQGRTPPGGPLRATAGSGPATPGGWTPTGIVFLHDRIKDMIVSGGENVYPAEVENALLSHAAVADAAVIGVPDDRWGETVKAIVVRTPDAAADDAELAADIIAATRERLAHFKCPTSVDFVEVLPRNPSGQDPETRAPQPRTGRAGPGRSS